VETIGLVRLDLVVEAVRLPGLCEEDDADGPPEVVELKAAAPCRVHDGGVVYDLHGDLLSEWCVFVCISFAISALMRPSRDFFTTWVWSFWNSKGDFPLRLTDTETKTVSGFHTHLLAAWE
jgi:hypothetical protein